MHIYKLDQSEQHTRSMLAEREKVIGGLMLYLHIERKSVFLEGVEIKNQLLATFGERGQVTIAIHVDRLALENLVSIDQKCNITG